MSLTKFFRSRYFLLHIGLTIIFFFIIIWLSLKFLEVFTSHGQSIIVTDFQGKHISELDDLADENDLNYEIIDSIYDFSIKKGTVVLQDPAAGTRVKSGRKVYLTVVAQKPEQVPMPDLVDLTLRQASAMLETFGLRVGKLQYVPDIANNAVLKQKFNGKTIEEGTLIEKGSVIDLVLGQGTENEKTEIPDIIGMKQENALKLLQQFSLNVGEQNFDSGTDSSNARVYKTKPLPRTIVNMGMAVEIWYKHEKKMDPGKLKNK